MRIGIISDTHWLLRKEVENQLKDCDLIVHCGDIGKQEVIDKLSELGKVELIKGNVDKDIDISLAPKDKIIEVMNKRIYLIHNIAELNIDLYKGNIDIVMYGHSHKSKIYKEDGILYINPGSVGPRRFKLPTTMMKLTILDNESKDIQETKENTFIYKCYRVEQITID